MLEPYYKNNLVTLYHGDCLEVMPQLTEKFDCCITDPPYRVTPKGNYGNMGGICSKKQYMKGLVFKYNDISPKEYAVSVFNVLKNDSHFYVMTNNSNLIKMLNEISSSGFKFVKSIIWDKARKISGTYYMSQYEHILFFRMPVGRKINNCGTSDIITIPLNKHRINGENIHDSEKPVELMKILIENSSKEKDIIIDPFAGSGTTGIACMRTNRRCVMIEMDEKYCEATTRRLDEEVESMGLFLH